jgi:hypothetical protein
MMLWSYIYYEHIYIQQWSIKRKVRQRVMSDHIYMLYNFTQNIYIQYKIQSVLAANQIHELISVNIYKMTSYYKERRGERNFDLEN